jgi:hypothetical protein
VVTGFTSIFPLYKPLDDDVARGNGKSAVLLGEYFDPIV